MKKLFFSMCLLVLLTIQAQANNLKIDNIAYDKAGNSLSFDLSWENSWNINEDYHDAVWVFVKYKASNSVQWKPVAIDGADITTSGLTITPKGIGFIARNSENTDGQVDIPATTITISGMQLDGVNPSFKVFGIEMVYVPEGSFELGDGSGDSLVFVQQTSIEPLTVDAATSFVYTSDDQSVQQFAVGNDFPTGYRAFYCMKYEITQGQVVDFLNTLTTDQLLQLNFFQFVNENKYPLALSPTPINRMAIAYIENNIAQGKPSVFGMDLNNNDVFDEPEDGATLACNYLKFRDFLSYLDWAGLRPMSEMEYEKASRGFDPAVKRDFATGVPFNDITATGDINNAGTSEETFPGINLNLSSELGPLRVGFAAMEGSDRFESGSSYFGIANLSDNISEWTVKADREGFTYDLHGDGLSDASSNFGDHNSWKQAAGIRRGGSHYKFTDLTIYGSVSDRVNPDRIRQIYQEGGRGVLSAQ